MSLSFNKPTEKDGIIQTIERRLFGDTGYGHISNNVDRMAGFTAEVNLTLSKALSLIFEADGRWQFDDSNHTDPSGNLTYPIIKGNLVSGQRDYPFLTDDNNNLILDIYKVAILPSSTATLYEELAPLDELMDTNMIAESSTTGVPTAYGKLSNGVFLDTPPSYNATNGIKLYISREASSFAVTDTAKKPGFAGLYHEYLALVPAYNYARDNSMPIAEQLKRDIREMEVEIKKHYSRRSKDERPAMRGKKVLFI